MAVRIILLENSEGGVAPPSLLACLLACLLAYNKNEHHVITMFSVGEGCVDFLFARGQGGLLGD